VDEGFYQIDDVSVSATRQLRLAHKIPDPFFLFLFSFIIKKLEIFFYLCYDIKL
jgi:hypothetical protein